MRLRLADELWPVVRRDGFDFCRRQLLDRLRDQRLAEAMAVLQRQFEIERRADHVRTAHMIDDEPIAAAARMGARDKTDAVHIMLIDANKQGVAVAWGAPAMPA